RRDPCIGAARDLGVGGEEGLPQFGEAVAAEGGGEEQPVGREVGADAAQVAGNVVDQLQVEQRDDEVVVISRQVQLLRIDPVSAVQGGEPLEGEAALAAVAALGQRRCIGGQQQRPLEAADDGQQPVLEIVQHQAGDEVLAAAAAGQAPGNQ